jgi:DNA topoisomerase IA
MKTTNTTKSNSRIVERIDRKHKARIERLQFRLAKLTEDIYAEYEYATVKTLKNRRDLYSTWDHLDWAKYRLDDAFRSM